MSSPPFDSTIAGAIIGVAFGTALPWPLKMIWRLIRGSPEREASANELAAERDGDMIQRLINRAHDVEAYLEVLRKALDKNLVRENSVVTAAELLLGIVELIDKPSPAMRAMRLRAVEILSLARHMNKGGEDA